MRLPSQPMSLNAAVAGIRGRMIFTMSRKLHHHFVPQYHFRLFTGGDRRIHLASRDGTRIVRFAGIKGQCARHKFYGYESLEDWLGDLETAHAGVYRRVIAMAWDAGSPRLSPDDEHRMREAVMLQRARTPRTARMMASSLDQMMFHAFREHLVALPATPGHDAMIRAINEGRVTLKDSLFTALVMSLGMAMRGASYLRSDVACTTQPD